MKENRPIGKMELARCPIKRTKTSLGSVNEVGPLKSYSSSEEMMSDKKLGCLLQQQQQQVMAQSESLGMTPERGNAYLLKTQGYHQQQHQQQYFFPPTRMPLVARTDASSEPEAPAKSHLSYCFPLFSTGDVYLSLKQIDLFFKLAKIDDEEDKFRMFVTHMKPSLLIHVKDLLENEEIDNKYTQLKSRLTMLFRKSDRQSVQEVVRNAVATQMRPTSLLMSLHANYKVDKGVGEEFFRDTMLGFVKDKYKQALNGCLNCERLFAKLDDLIDLHGHDELFEPVQETSLRGDHSLLLLQIRNCLSKLKIIF